MRASKVMLPLAATLVWGATTGALAGPQSALDPYAYVQAPSSQYSPVRARGARSKVVRDALPSAPQKGGSNEFVAGTREIGSGIARTTKGAATGLMSVGGGVMSGSRKLGAEIAHGAMASTGFLGKGARAVGHGVATAGDKVKDGAVAVGETAAVVPKKMGEGFKSTGEKLKDGTLAVGKKLAAFPRALGKGMVATASKTGETTRKVAAMPVAVGRGLSRLNPFRHQQAPAAPPVATASSPAVQQ